MTLSPSELILNPDGSIYHLNLLPDDIAETIIFVGDPDRVSHVSKYFDHIEFKKHKREFVTHTGSLNHQRMTVISTGIGTDNVDIVLNECDALMNIDFKTRRIKEKIKKLRFIRLGTCGALRAEIPVDSLIVSRYAIGLDSLMSYYRWQPNDDEKKLFMLSQSVFSDHAFYVASGTNALITQFEKIATAGVTVTCPSFYGAQHRQLRAPLAQENILSAAASLHFQDTAVLNLEMETAGIYGLSRLLNHDACSISVVAANRVTNTFSNDIENAIDQMIQQSLMIVSDKTND